MYYKVTGNKLHIFNDKYEFLCTHELSEGQGTYNQLEEHKKQESKAYLEIVNRLRTKWDCYDFQHFVNGVKKDNPRYLCEQFRAIEEFLDTQNPDRALVAEVMRIACVNLDYKFSRFQAVFLQVRDGTYVERPRDIAWREAHQKEAQQRDLQQADLSAYQKAFDERCADQDKEGCA